MAVNLFDLETISSHFSSPEQFIQYLEQREKLHGFVTTGDELNFAGYFLKFGHLKFTEKTFLHDDFASIFDRRWYKERGVDIPEPTNPPVSTLITRKGNRLVFEQGSDRQIVKLPPYTIETAGKTPIRMKGSERNKPCPCGSGLKLKHCCGV